MQVFVQHALAQSYMEAEPVVKMLQHALECKSPALRMTALCLSFLCSEVRPCPRHGALPLLPLLRGGAREAKQGAPQRCASLLFCSWQTGSEQPALLGPTRWRLFSDQRRHPHTRTTHHAHAPVQAVFAHVIRLVPVLPSLQTVFEQVCIEANKVIVELGQGSYQSIKRHTNLTSTCHQVTPGASPPRPPGLLTRGGAGRVTRRLPRRRRAEQLPPLLLSRPRQCGLLQAGAGTT